MAEEISEPAEEKNEELSSYELGVLIAPTVPEEKIPAEFGDLVALVEKTGGLVSASDLPKMMMLAYPVYQTREHKRTSFNQAYFGWLRFESPAVSSQTIHDELKRHGEVLRFLIIALPKITAQAPRRRSVAPRRGPALGPETLAAVPMTQEQIDKEIEQLLAGAEVK